MYEIIISSVKTGRVRRAFFETRQEAEAHFDRFLENPNGFHPRNRRDYRAEVYLRPLPEVRPVRRRKLTTTAA
jgi:hypothetical protein